MTTETILHTEAAYRTERAAAGGRARATPHSRRVRAGFRAHPVSLTRPGRLVPSPVGGTVSA